MGKETIAQAVYRVQQDEPTFEHFMWVERNEINKRTFGYGVHCGSTGDEAAQNALCGAAQSEMEMAWDMFCAETHKEIGDHHDFNAYSICHCTGHVTMALEHCCEECHKRENPPEEKISEQQKGIRLVSNNGNTIEDNL